MTKTRIAVCQLCSTADKVWLENAERRKQLINGHNFQDILNFGIKSYFWYPDFEPSKVSCKFCSIFWIYFRGRKSRMQNRFLPEGFDFIGSNINNTLAQSEKIDGPLIEKLKTLAVEKKIWLSLGGFHEKIDENYSDGKR